MPLYLVSKLRKQYALEVLSFDKENSVAVLRGNEGVFTDTNFYIAIIRRVFDLTDKKPEYLE